jgi:hypothetical protein
MVVDGVTLSLFPHADVTAPIPTIAATPTIPATRRTRRGDRIAPLPRLFDRTCPVYGEVKSTRDGEHGSMPDGCGGRRLIASQGCLLDIFPSTRLLCGRPSISRNRRAQTGEALSHNAIGRNGPRCETSGGASVGAYRWGVRVDVDEAQDTYPILRLGATLAAPVPPRRQQSTPKTTSTATASTLVLVGRNDRPP